MYQYWSDSVLNNNGEFISSKRTHVDAVFEDRFFAPITSNSLLTTPAQFSTNFVVNINDDTTKRIFMENDDHANDMTTTSVILTDGTPAIGRFEGPNDVDWFRIDVKARDVISIDLYSVDGNGRPLLSVFDIDGNAVDFRPMNNTLNRFFASSEDATFFLVASPFTASNPDPDPYRFIVTTKEDEFTANTETTGVIVVDGATVTSSYEGYDEDWFRVSVAEGDIIHFGVDREGRNIRFSGEILDSDGNVVSQSGSGLFMSFIAAETTDYFFSISGTGYQNRADFYTITATSATDDAGQTISTAADIALNSGPLSGAIDFRGDQDVYKITLTEGQIVSLNYEIYDNWQNVFRLNVYEMDGTTRIVPEFASSGDYNFTATYSGDYYIQIDSRNEFSAYGRYDLDVSVELDEIGEGPSQAVRIDIDGDTLNSRMNFADDEDWFAIDLSSGTSTGVHLNTDGSGMRVDFFDSDGRRFITPLVLSSSENPDGSTDRLYDVLAEYDGPFYMRVISGGISDYSIRAFSFDDDYADSTDTLGRVVVDGNSVTGVSGTQADWDWFAFDAEAGQAIDFNIDHSLSLVRTRLYDADGILVGSTYRNSSSPYEITETGQYFFAVNVLYATSVSSTTGYDYELSLTSLDDDFGTTIQTAGLLSPDASPLTVQANYVGDNDWLEFSISDGKAVEFLIDSSTGGLGELIFSFRDAAGELIQTVGSYVNYIYNSLDYYSVFQLPEAGTYYLDIESLNGHSDQSYEITMQSPDDDFGASFENAQDVTIGTNDQAVQHNYMNDYDTFSFIGVAGQQLSIRAVNDTDLTKKIYLYDENGNLISDSISLFFSNGIFGVIDFEVEQTGTFYIRTTMGEASPQDYTLAIFEAEPLGLNFDRIDGTPEGDDFSGTEQQDFLYGNYGDDRIDGLGGDDIIEGGFGDDLIFGGNGDDDLAAGHGTDVIHGGDGNDIIEGLSGENTVFGDDGNDTINVGGSNSLAHGGIGNDTINIGGSNSFAYGGIGDDSITVGGLNTVAYGGAGDDTFYGARGEDWKAYGGDGADIFIGFTDTDRFYGEDGNDLLNGNAGNDFLYGGIGNDTIFGGLDRDFIYGGDGDDRIDGGAGNDIISGGLGRDKFIFIDNSGTDVITDFDINQDILIIDLDPYTSASEIFGMMTEYETFTEISLGFGRFVRLQNVSIEDLSLSNFIFDNGHADGPGPFRPDTYVKSNQSDAKHILEGELSETTPYAEKGDALQIAISESSNNIELCDDINTHFDTLSIGIESISNQGLI